MALSLLALVLAGLWFHNMQRDSWQRTGGRVVHCEIRDTHYNATDLRRKVTMTYEYDVAGIPFVATWIGYWPEVEEQSPNALPPDKINNLLTPGYPLTVLYDPDSPKQSTLLDVSRGTQTLYQWLFTGVCLAGLYYLVRIYPAWKLR